MAGTLAGALEVRGIPSHPDKLKTTVEGDIEDVDGKPVITNIRIKYHLTVPEGTREKAERALSRHKERCAASTSVERGIQVSWDAEVVEE
ncbi:MAG: OsmC family protein [Nitrospinota bacterium]